MPKSAVCLALLVLLPASVIPARAQRSADPAQSASPADAARASANFYRLDFVLEELDSAAKPVNSRSFSVIVSTAGTRAASFTAGSKIPIITGTHNPKDDPSGSASEFQYIDIGTKITASDAREVRNQLSFNLHAEVSSLATPAMLHGISEPVLRENVWSGDVLIPIAKGTPVFKSASLEGKGSMQLEVTATLLD